MISYYTPHLAIFVTIKSGAVSTNMAYWYLAHQHTTIQKQNKKLSKCTPIIQTYAHVTTHAIVAESNSFKEKIIAKTTVGQMDLYDGHFKYT